jgi:hypothetical protein
MLGSRRRGRWISILVLGTRSEVWPTSGFVARARERGARIDAKEERRGESGEAGGEIEESCVRWKSSDDVEQGLFFCGEGYY